MTIESMHSKTTKTLPTIKSINIKHGTYLYSMAVSSGPYIQNIQVERTYLPSTYIGMVFAASN